MAGVNGGDGGVRNAASDGYEVDRARQRMVVTSIGIQLTNHYNWASVLSATLITDLQ